MNRTYHPKSWSQQARKMGTNIFNITVFYIEHPWEWEKLTYYTRDGFTPEQYATRIFQNSYRHPLIRERAAKRYGKLMKEYKKKKLAN